jgi:hypothetical protein
LYQRSPIHVLYRKLLTLYPKAYRERFLESMQQTFNDLYREWKQDGRRGLFLSALRIFTETSVGILREHVLSVRGKTTMKNILSNPTLAALASLILALPLGLTFVAFMFDIQPLVNLLNGLFTIPDQPGEINMLGRIVVFGGLLLLPVALALNLSPLLNKAGSGETRILYRVNLLVGALILLLILFTWGGLLIEKIYCLQGIRCD